MFTKLFQTSAALLTLGAQAGFVTDLLTQTNADSNSNLQEYYGRMDNSGDSDGSSTVFFTALLNYEHDTETLRLHFNMKEPFRQSKDGEEDEFFSETDFQWNTSIWLKDKEQSKLVNQAKE